MEKDIFFKKARFGGFDKTDVMNYIAKITDEFKNYKAETLKTIEDLKSKADEIESAYQLLKDEYDDLRKKYDDKENKGKEISKGDFSAAKSEIKSLVENLCNNMNHFLLSLPDDETGEAWEDDSDNRDNTVLTDDSVPFDDDSLDTDFKDEALFTDESLDTDFQEEAPFTDESLDSDFQEALFADDLSDTDALFADDLLDADLQEETVLEDASLDTDLQEETVLEDASLDTDLQEETVSEGDSSEDAASDDDLLDDLLGDDLRKLIDKYTS